MIVDDTHLNLKLLSHILTRQGYAVRALSDGPSALASAVEDPPDLILLDILMPGMDGYQVCQKFKEQERTRDIPVLFMSALDQVGDKVKAFSAGGVDYITKPFQAQEVLARVATHLTLQSLKKQLEDQVEALQESNAELDAFAHTVAHDIKNPLSSIIMGAELMQQLIRPLTDDPAVLRIARDVEISSRKTVNIIDELLLLASVRQEDIVRSPLEMGSIVRHARRRLDWLVEQYDGQIELPERWPIALGYGPWVEEVWVNYISNALKYGGDPPQVRLGGGSGPDGTVCFWVQDNGPGIAPEKAETLFTEFTRLERTPAEGHGLGLSIVKRILNRLGGEVGLESTVGAGSTFYFYLPAAER
jgi:signal transduction histidine kinase